MPQPYLKETATDGALGLVAGDALKVFAIIGLCSLLTANTVGAFTNLQALKDGAGVGPAVEQAAQVLTECGGGATVLLVCPSSTAGSLTAGVQIGSGLGTVANSSSTPVDDYDLVVRIVTGGAVATATFAYSLDGGRTYSNEIATAATYAIPGTGITVAFNSGAGVFVAGDRYPFEAKGPSYSVSQFNTAFDALVADGTEFSLLHVVGIPADTPTLASLAAAVESKLAAVSIDRHMQVRGFVDGPEGVTNSALKTAVAGISASPRTLIGADFCPLTSVLSSRVEKRPAAWPMFARACKVSISTALHATDPNESGPLPRVGPLKSRAGDPVQYAYHDETTATVKLDEGRIACLRTWPGQSGVFINRARTLAALTSDFTELHRGRVLDEAMREGYRYMFPIVGSKQGVNRLDGRISERDALGIETGGRSRLVSKLVNTNHADDAQFIVVRSDNVLASGLLKYRVRVLPKFHPDYIEGEFGFFNPALS
ncbi:MAG: DUF2586 family protein [Polyangiaceae bacterium]|jgi:hypothetical protein|nr:DUF2586 family protein [Polyangiaceae bacterium]